MKTRYFMVDCLTNNANAEKKSRVKERLLDLSPRTVMVAFGQAAPEE
jgi:hypothetical protein